jgi:hypothetical protein
MIDTIDGRMHPVPGANAVILPGFYSAEARRAEMMQSSSSHDAVSSSHIFLFYIT